MIIGYWMTTTRHIIIIIIIKYTVMYMTNDWKMSLMPPWLVPSASSDHDLTKTTGNLTN